jgi:hypothetical protein
MVSVIRYSRRENILKSRQDDAGVVVEGSGAVRSTERTTSFSVMKTGRYRIPAIWDIEMLKCEPRGDVGPHEDICPTVSRHRSIQYPSE